MHLSLWSVSKNPQSRHENYRKEHCMGLEPIKSYAALRTSTCQCSYLIVAGYASSVLRPQFGKSSN
ncbi:hypothetical protein BU9_CDS0072 [Klebsiella phage Kpn BU9]|nr:hypothetical protein BU9_CDS0072 [Klebsiella phage Kpn BU9]